jgi:hypothetical protein
VNAIDDRYRRALVEEYESYVRADRTEEAEHVAGVLREQYGYDVDEQARPKEPVQQTEAEPRLPEAAVAPKPEPPTAEAKPSGAKKAAAKRVPAKPTEGK